MDQSVPLLKTPGAHRIEVPPSKSLHQRLLVLTSLRGGTQEDLDRALQSDRGPAEDVRAVYRALGALGPWDSALGSLGSSRASLRLDMGFGATGFRFMTALASLRPPGARTLITGRPELRARPHGALLGALRGLGVAIKRRHSGAIRVHGGGWRTRAIRLPAASTSQHISALCLAATRGGPLALSIQGALVSAPYVGLTLSMLARAGASVEGRDLLSDRPTFRAEPGFTGGAPLATQDLPADASAAASLFAAAAATGTRLTVPGLIAWGGGNHADADAHQAGASQADMALLEVLRAMGAQVEVSGDAVTVEGPARGLRGAGEVVLRDAPDLLPVVAALGALAAGPTQIRGAAHARVKESDRIERMASVLSAMGADVSAAADGLTLAGCGGDPSTLRGIPVSAGDDHRLAFAMGVLGLRVPGVLVHGAESVAKSHPRFWRDIANIAGCPA